MCGAHILDVLRYIQKINNQVYCLILNIILYHNSFNRIIIASSSTVYPSILLRISKFI